MHISIQPLTSAGLDATDEVIKAAYNIAHRSILPFVLPTSQKSERTLYLNGIGVQSYVPCLNGRLYK
jgi:hypothetical protein